MTTNNKEVESWEVCFDKQFIPNDGSIPTYIENGNDLKAFLHQELQKAEQRGEDRMKRAQTQTDDYFELKLQKARQDWLREEIVKLEGMKQIVGGQLEISPDESLVKMVSNVIGLKEEMAHNKALQTIIDRYYSELDQDKN